MPIHLNHTIVASTDRREAAEFFGHIFDLAVGAPAGFFIPVQLGNGVTLDFATMPDGAPVPPQHYAFLVSETDFDGVFARIQAARVDFWADPRQSEPGRINHNDGGRGVYFLDPSGHYLEAITRPYGGGDPL
ncbi:VOC family protein [Longispora sp. NPDC051575]|uniref:VOC family protein n=1 Tax=Longispora sp. NPDC051575 TaxID=3154943 RepID=UPI003437C0EB